MKAKQVAILAAAGLAVYVLSLAMAKKSGGQYWVTAQGNTAFPQEAYTGTPAAGGGVWI